MSSNPLHQSLANRSLALLLFFALASFAGETPAPPAARTGFGASLSLPNGVSFAPVVFDQIWKRHGASGSAEAFAMECGAGTSENATDGALRFSGRASFSEKDGTIAAEWHVIPDRDGCPQSVCVGARFAKAKCAGGVRVDGDIVPVGDGVPPDPHLFHGTASVMELLEADGASWLAISFPERAKVLVQDNQLWGKPVMEIRLILAGDKVEDGREYSLKAIFSTPGAPLPLAVDKPVRMETGPDWIPCPAAPAGEDWIEPGSALDFTGVVPHHEPAGKFGRVVVVGDHFELEGRPGEEFKMCGANIVHGANVPDPASADRFAANLARLGYNTVRIHHHEAWMINPRVKGATQGGVRGEDSPRPLQGAALEVPPEGWERFDALVAACIRHGLYITTDLYVSRYKAMTWRALGIDRDGRIDQRQLKVMFAFNEAAYSNLVAWTRLFLTHVNPHTGRSLADEPALCSLALINEGNLGNDGLALLAKVPEVAAAWAEWRTGGSGGAAPRPFPSDVYGGGQDIADFALFLAEREQRLYERLSAEVRAIGCRAPLSNLSSWYYPAQYLLPISRFDYMDSHFYVDHPMFLGKNWQFPSACGGDNPFRVCADVPAAAWRRYLGKPFCITEWNWSAPGPFRSASGLAVGALAARQGWSGLWRFAWSHDREGVDAPGSLPMRYFDLHSDPVSLASERATLCLFLRGDMVALPPGSERAAEWDEAALVSGELGAPRLGAPISGVSPWKTRVGVRLGNASLGKSFVSPAMSASNKSVLSPAQSASNKSVVLPAPSGNVSDGTFRVITPRTCGGFAESGNIQCGTLKFTLLAGSADIADGSDIGNRDIGDIGNAGNTAVPAAIWATALDNAPLATSSRILVAHVTDARNTGAVFGGDDARVWQKKGRTPALVRRGRAKIELKFEISNLKSQIHVFRLSPTGHRMAEVPYNLAVSGEAQNTVSGEAQNTVSGKAQNTLYFTADTAYDPSSATIFYEIVRQQP